MSSVLMVKDNLVHYLVQSGEIFQTIPEWAQNIQPQTPEKKAKNHHWPENFHENLVPLPSYLSFRLILIKILKASLKTFPTKMKPPKCPAKEEKMKQEKGKRGEERKWKVKVKTVVSLLNTKTISKFCFLYKPKRRKLIFCIWREEYDL